MGFIAGYCRSKRVSEEFPEGLRSFSRGSCGDYRDGF